jgi:hypothetical protein
MTRKSRTSVLLVDAEDTSWEKNIYFERAQVQFLQGMEYLGHIVNMLSSRLAPWEDL